MWENRKVKNRKKRRFLLIGYGSIGKRHFEKIIPLAETIYIVDPLKPQENFSDSAKFNWIDNISKVPNQYFLEDDIAIVANWGPDHFSTVKKLIEINCKKIVLEKPMVCSIKELERLSNLVVNANIDLVVNQGWHHSNLASRINNLSKSENFE